MFGRKDAKIKELELKLSQEIDKNVIEWTRQAQYITKLEKTELKLMGQIREMDQILWNMGQQTHEAGILALLRTILPVVERRKQLESDRIATVLIPEMQKAYRDESTALEKQIPGYFKKAKS